MKALVCVLAFLATMVTPALVAAAAPSAATDAPAAVQTREPIDESALDRHTHKIAEQLRCLVCQGETVADSHATLAQDMRSKIREKLQQGWSDKQIFDYFVARYGDFVLYRPPVKATTWALWFGPAIMLVLGLLFLFGYLRARARLTARDSLSPEDAERARTLLGAGEDSPR